MSWKSEKIYPGGTVVYEAIPNCDKYWIIYRQPDGGDFLRGTISRFELIRDGHGR